MGFLRRFRRHLATVKKGMAALLVLVGFASLTGGASDFSVWRQSDFLILSRQR